MMEIDRYAALNSICQKLEEISRHYTAEQIRRNAALALDADLAFMKSSGVFEGEEYDDYAAFDYLSKQLPRMGIEEDFIEDYMEAMEAYLVGENIIAWDGK